MLGYDKQQPERKEKWGCNIVSCREEAFLKKCTSYYSMKLAKKAWQTTSIFFKSNANNPCETWNLCRSTRDWVVCYIVFKPVCSLVPAEWSCALVPSIKSPLVHWALRSDLLIIPRRACLRDQHNMVVSGMESGLQFPAMLLLVDRHMALEIN